MGATCCNKRNDITYDFKGPKRPARRKSSILFEKFSNKYDYKKKYEYIAMLGNGGFGKVRLYRDRICRDMMYAIKTLKKNFLNIHNIQSIVDEVNILRQLDHPNIVKYFETFEDEYYIHIVMEYIPGDNLFKMITSRYYSNFGEKEASEIMTCLLKAVFFLHSHSIVHRDIKPENILFSVTGDTKSLKLIDFGLSVSKLSPKDRHRVGSPYYMAPEMIDGVYSYESDTWSIGVILYVMMTGAQPFQGKEREGVFEKIVKGNYDAKLLDKQNCSVGLKDLIKKCLVLDRQKRLTIQEALEHPWIKNHDQDEVTKIDERILTSLKNFTYSNPLQKEIFFYLAKISSESEIQKLKQAFMEIDVDNTGTIEYNEIFNIFEKLGLQPEKDEIKAIWENLDFHHDGKVNYSEFLAGTLSSLQFNKEEKLWSAFKYFDSDNTGFVTYESVLNALKASNVPINESGLSNVFENLKKQKKKVNFEEFKKMVCA